MSLQNELDFLKSLCIRAAGGSISAPEEPCKHSDDIAAIIIEKEHIFFREDISEKERNDLLKNVDIMLSGIVCDCQKTKSC